MKLLLFTLTCCTIGTVANAQWGCNSIIAFDETATISAATIVIDTTHYRHNVWQVGTPHKTVFLSAASLPGAIVTYLPGPYPANDTSVFILQAPLSLQDGSKLLELQFSYWLDIDTDAVASVEISADKGLHWSNVIDSLPANFYWDGDTANLSSSTNGWKHFFLVYRCTGCIIETDSILFRFTFASDSVQSSRDGWMIDNIDVSYWCGTGTNNSFVGLYPNPAVTELNISATEVITDITIINVLGQVVDKQTYSNTMVQMDVSRLIAGIYFVKINGEDTQKFVKE